MSTFRQEPKPYEVRPADVTTWRAGDLVFWVWNLVRPHPIGSTLCCDQLVCAKCSGYVHRIAHPTPDLKSPETMPRAMCEQCNSGLATRARLNSYDWTPGAHP